MSGLWKWNKKERYKIICDITEKEFPLNNVHTEGMNRYPVSYTHLDVYKRQHFIFNLIMPQRMHPVWLLEI